jgi:hypothetical protein
MHGRFRGYVCRTNRQPHTLTPSIVTTYASPSAVPWWVRWAVVAGLAAFIFYASIVTVPPETVVDQLRPGPERLLPLDRWRHLLAYATFGYTLAYATTD